MKKAAATRQLILEKAFEAIYERGYQSTSIDDIIATTAVTKGAFYYHFKNKDEMGVAIINDLLKPALSASFADPLQKKENPLEAIYTMIYNLLLKNSFLKVAYGCPVSNLTQEMAAGNTEFGAALQAVADEWTSLLIETLERGKKTGFVSKDVNTKEATLFIMSGYWGIRNFGKLDGRKDVYKPYLRALKSYLSTLQ